MCKNSHISGLLALTLVGACVAHLPCIATNYSQIAPCVQNSTNIVLKDLYAPSNCSIDLRKVMPGTTITFAGKTTFGFTNYSSFEPIQLGGSGITVTGEPDSIIDGNGQAYWDGLGSNGGVPKPNHFISASKLICGSVIRNLYIQNWPVHLFTIKGADGLIMENLILNNTAGDAPNAASNGLAAAHNSDGFDLINSNNTIVRNSTIWNQDDCVAITSGNNVTVDGLYCHGGHGLSIGSVGGKASNVVTNVVFKNSKLVNSENGARIKSNSGTTGYIANITYSNIQFSGVYRYGIVIQQDYLNGGATGIATNGVLIEDILFENVSGTVLPSAQNYLILCGDGSCKNFNFTNVHVTGGDKESSCNFPERSCT